jgi:hypothetical protein
MWPTWVWAREPFPGKPHNAALGVTEDTMARNVNHVSTAPITDQTDLLSTTTMQSFRPDSMIRSRTSTLRAS